MLWPGCRLLIYGGYVSYHAKITFTLKEDWRKRVEGKEEIMDVNRATDENMKAVLEMCNYSITIK